MLLETAVEAELAAEPKHAVPKLLALRVVQQIVSIALHEELEELLGEGDISDEDA
jgi:hypothetical protein